MENKIKSEFEKGIVFTESEIPELLDCDFIRLNINQNIDDTVMVGYMVKMGLQITMANNIKKAIRILQSFNYKIELIDISAIDISIKGLYSYLVKFKLAGNESIYINVLDDEPIYLKNFTNNDIDKVKLLVSILFDENLENKEINYKEVL